MTETDGGRAVKVNSEGVADRQTELLTNKHLIEQVQRIMPALTMTRGTASVPEFDSVLRDVAFGISALEANPEIPVIYGMVMVARNPASGYDLYVHGCTVYDMQMRFDDRKKEK